MGGMAEPDTRPLGRGQVLGQQHLDPFADPVLGPLRGQLLDQVGDPAHAGVDLGLVELAGQARIASVPSSSE